MPAAWRLSMAWCGLPRLLSQCNQQPGTVFSSHALACASAAGSQCTCRPRQVCRGVHTRSSIACRRSSSSHFFSMATLAHFFSHASDIISPCPAPAAPLTAGSPSQASRRQYAG